jgi:hypothetical protein
MLQFEAVLAACPSLVSCSLDVDDTFRAVAKAIADSDCAPSLRSVYVTTRDKKRLHTAASFLTEAELAHVFESCVRLEAFPGQFGFPIDGFTETLLTALTKSERKNVLKTMHVAAPVVDGKTVAPKSVWTAKQFDRLFRVSDRWDKINVTFEDLAEIKRDGQVDFDRFASFPSDGLVFTGPCKVSAATLSRILATGRRTCIGSRPWAALRLKPPPDDADVKLSHVLPAAMQEVYLYHAVLTSFTGDVLYQLLQLAHAGKVWKMRFCVPTAAAVALFDRSGLRSSSHCIWPFATSDLYHDEPAIAWEDAVHVVEFRTAGTDRRNRADWKAPW